MATWQYDLIMTPNVKLESCEVERRISTVFGKSRSWAASVRSWGLDDSDRIDIYLDGGYVDEFVVRCDLRNPSKSFLVQALSLLSFYGSTVTTEEGREIHPDLREVARDMMQATAFRFVANPSSFLEELGVPDNCPSRKVHPGDDEDEN